MTSTEIIHRWLRIPYKLHTRIVNAKTKPVATVVLIHGIGNNGDYWNNLIEKMPKNVKIITIDLLGFGKSPKQHWISYDAKTQARSVFATIFKERFFGKLIIVGHSLGALVAVEIAERYPLLASSMILCSPPFYNQELDGSGIISRSDKVLKDIYKTAQRYPEQFIRMANVAKRYGLINKEFNLTNQNVNVFMETLKTAIVNQTSFQDARRLKLPITIIRGTLDPLVVARNLKELTKGSRNIRLKTVVAGHEVTGPMAKMVVNIINAQVSSRL
jgi:pimeloyl-ACP methyl ester carboxylesterase